MSKLVTRSHAKRNKLIAQCAALLLAGAALGVGVLGLPLLNDLTTEIETVEVAMAKRQAEQDRMNSVLPADDETELAQAVDLLAVAERLSVLGDPPPTVHTTTDETNPQPEEFVEASKTELKYLGNIVEPNRRLALLSLNGVQRIVPMGGATTITTPDGGKVTLRVIGVSNEEVIVERGEGRERIAKADRISQAVTMVQSVGVQPGSPAAIESGLTPEESEIERRRREAEDRRQRMLDRQRDMNGGRRPEFDPAGRQNRDEPQK